MSDSGATTVTMTMRDTLDQLLALQAVDSGIKALTDALALMPKQLQEAEEEEQGVQAQVDEVQSRIDAIHKLRRDLEQEIEDCGKNVNTFENQKLSVKTNDEYAALNHQIAHQKERRSGLEDKVLESFEDEEAAAQRVTYVSTKLAETKKRIAAHRAELESRATQDEQRLGELKESRDRIAPGVDASMLRVYESLRAKKQGLAVAGVSGGSCGGCFAALPPQRVHEVRKHDQRIHCEACGRFLIHDPAAE